MPERRAVFGEPILFLHLGPGVHVRAIEKDDGLGGGLGSERRGRAGDVLEIEGLARLRRLEVAAVMAPVQPSPVNSTSPPDASPWRMATGLSFGYIEFAEDVGLIFVARPLATGS